MALVALVLTWAAVFFKAPGVWRRDAPPARRALWAALLALALGWAVRVPAGYRGLDQWSGVPALAQLVGDALALTTACAITGMLLYQTTDAEQVRRRLLTRVAALLAVVAVMTASFIAAPVEEETTEFFERYAAEPLIVVYTLAYLAFVGYAFFDLAKLSRRFAALADRRFLRLGMRFIQTAGLLGLAYVALRLAYLGAAQAGLADELAAYDVVSKTLVATLSLLAVIGAVLPAVGTRLETYRAYRELRPLWAALYRSTPEIADDPPSLAQEVLSFLSLKRLRWQLRSRIIEIRDGRLALRSYFRRDVVDRARHLARRRALTGEEYTATVEAAALAAAVRDKTHGRTVPSKEVTAEPAPAPGGANLAGEVSWLRKVARAFTRSQVVRESAGRDDS